MLARPPARSLLGSHATARKMQRAGIRKRFSIRLFLIVSHFTGGEKAHDEEEEEDEEEQQQKEERELEPRMTMATQRQFPNALTNGRSLSTDANDDETGAVLSLPTNGRSAREVVPWGVDKSNNRAELYVHMTTSELHPGLTMKSRTSRKRGFLSFAFRREIDLV